MFVEMRKQLKDVASNVIQKAKKSLLLFEAYLRMQIVKTVLYYKVELHVFVMILTGVLISDFFEKLSFATNGNATLSDWFRVFLTLLLISIALSYFFFPDSFNDHIYKQYSTIFCDKKEEEQHAYNSEIEQYLQHVYFDESPHQEENEEPSSTLLTPAKYLQDNSDIMVEFGGNSYPILVNDLTKSKVLYQKIAEGDHMFKMDHNNCVIITRNEEYFEHVFKFLITGKSRFTDKNFKSLEECQTVHGVLIEARFYDLPGLAKICEEYLWAYSGYQGYRRMCYTKMERKMVIENEELVTFFVLGRGSKSQGQDGYFMGLNYAVEKLYTFETEHDGIYVLDLSEKETSKSFIEIFHNGNQIEKLELFDGKNQVSQNPEADIEKVFNHVLRTMLNQTGKNIKAPKALNKPQMRTVGDSNHKRLLSIMPES